MITGYAAVFYSPDLAGSEYGMGSRSGRQYVERIMPTAFDRAIREDDVVGLFNHDDNNVLGRTTSGTMRLSVDRYGLRYEITPAETQLHNQVSVWQERGDISGSSFGFMLGEDDFEVRSEDNVMIREINSVSRLLDVGPVTFPAYPATANGRQLRCVSPDRIALPCSTESVVRAEMYRSLRSKELTVFQRSLTHGR